MTTIQKIYGRWEYSLGEISDDELFGFYRKNKVFDEIGRQIGGISCARNVTNNTAILLTYDEASELMLTLKFAHNEKIMHHSIISLRTIE